MSKSSSFLLWDLTSCPAVNCDVLQSVISLTGYRYSTFLIFADNSKELPSSVSDFSIAANVIVHFGEYAIYDTVADLMNCIKSTKKFNISVISTRLSVWLSLLQRCQPSNFIIFSAADPRNDFDFSFLPSTIPTKIYQWPSLGLIDDDVSGASDHRESDDDEEEEANKRPPKQYKTPTRHQQQQQQSSEDEEDDSDSNPLSPSINPSPMQQNLLESNKRLNFKAGQANQLDSPPQQTNQKGGKRKSAGNAQNILTISAEFRPLIEAMKSVGKSMVALNDFESHLKSFCQSEGIKVPDVMTLIQNGVDAGIIIFDQTINYIRFRNRSISTGQIQYE